VQTSPTAPTLFPLAQCGSGTGDMMTVGCIATGFTPASLTFKWNEEGGNSLTDFVQYPAVVLPGGSYMGVSQLRVKRADWDSKILECAVEHSAGSKKRPSLYVMTPSKEEMEENKTASFACFASDFSPRTHNIKWMRKEKETGKEKEVVSDFKSSCESEKKSEKTLYSSTSYLRVNESEWKSEEVTFTCVFESKAGNVMRTVGDPKRPSVFLLAPAEQTSSDTVTLTCYVKDFYPKDVLVAWLVDDEPVERTSSSAMYQFNTTSQIQSGRTYSVYSQLTFSNYLWKNKEVVYSCVVYHESMIKSTKILMRTIDRTSNQPNLVNLSLNVPQRCNPHSYSCLSRLPTFVNTMETDRDSMGKTAFTFIILFLITLLYGVGATSIKVMPCWKSGVFTKWDKLLSDFTFCSRLGERGIPSQLSCTFNPTPLNQRGTGGCHNQHPHLQS
uniref:Ig-like domain-containing protein n=1 Tax=Hucho hucho TaxID=62062 RepID=A0A4W5PCG4_9TELE